MKVGGAFLQTKNAQRHLLVASQDEELSGGGVGAQNYNRDKRYGSTENNFNYLIEEGVKSGEIKNAPKKVYNRRSRQKTGAKTSMVEKLLEASPIAPPILIDINERKNT